MAKKKAENLPDKVEEVVEVKAELAADDQPEVDNAQEIETAAYVPTYKVKPEFKQAVLQAIGDRPFNEIAGLVNAINVQVMDHNTLTQVINAIGQFPFTKVEKLLANVNSFVEQVIED